MMEPVVIGFLGSLIIAPLGVAAVYLFGCYVIYLELKNEQDLS